MQFIRNMSVILFSLISKIKKLIIRSSYEKVIFIYCNCVIFNIAFCQ